MKLRNEFRFKAFNRPILHPWALRPCSIGMLAFAVLSGCTSPATSSHSEANETTTRSNPVDEKAEPAPKVSQVPLRIWVVGRMQQSENLVRQWLADDEQPAEVRVLSVDEFLATQSVQADVLIYPSRLLGELIQRQLVVKLPQSIFNPKRERPYSEVASDSQLSVTLNSLPALVSASSYDGFQFGMPLGFSVINLVGSSSTSVEQMNLEALMERLSGTAAEQLSTPLDIPQEIVDADALVDRFLSIAFGRTPANTRYGVLFEVRTMKSRLSQPEFAFAAELLTRLSRQKDGMQSVVGSHSDAWQWASQADSEAYVLVSATELVSTVRSMDRGRWIRLLDAENWNTGAGLIASISTQCRQSAQSARFIQWLCKTRTNASLESNMLGTVSLSKSTSYLADRINRQSISMLNDYNLSCEPRLPMAHQYRRALSSKLLLILSGQLSTADGLAQAAAAWDEITGEKTKSQQREYERSLGMTL